VNGWKRVLVLAPHTDDGEFGAGGTIARLCDAGAEVRYVAFSVPQPHDTLEQEVKRATAVLGIQPDHLDLHTFREREFPAQRQEILDLLVRLAADYEPDVVLCPSQHDVHQDHGVVHMEALRAFKRSTLLGYELPWNNYHFHYQAFVRLRDESLHKKILALAHYKSQFARPYANPSYMEAVALAHGVQAGCRYAEAFEVCRLIVQ
jgi:LmbE family N-acetylglucosaminyl deacetylase